MAIGIYVHIPFCKAKCLYCDFNSFAGLENLHSLYIQALCKEMENKKCQCEVDSLYIGGGTPTVLNPNDLIQILSCIDKNFLITKDCEITVECNPATIELDGLKKLRAAGVNRLSIGLQSANDKELARLGRIHTFEDFSVCFANARKAGFSNISLDLMYGLPKQEFSGWVDTLDKAVSFHPEHISCYALKLEEGTPLFEQNTILPDDDMVREYYDFCMDYLASKGFWHYEISNFSIPGKESRHNCKYWKCDDFLGFGAGAYSCFQNHRYNNIKDVSVYCEKINHGESIIAEDIFLTPEDRMSEFCFLGLRMNCGISMTEFKQRFDMDIMKVYGDAIRKNLKRGTLRRLDDRLFIPREWLYVSNTILLDFI